MAPAARNQEHKLIEEGRACMCFNLRKAARAVTQLYDEAMKSSGLGANQLSLLGITSAFGPATITQLADGLVTDRTTLTRNVRRLEQKGLVRVQPGHDRREHRVAITEKGRAVMGLVYPLWKDVQGRITKQLGGARAERLLSDLAALVEAAKCC